MPIRYFKSDPGQYVLVHRRGRLVRHGPGLAFWYLPHATVISVVPTVNLDAPFVFRETTANFQEVSIQGLLTYRLSKPLAIAERFDFTYDAVRRRHVGDDHDKPAQRLVNAIQAATRGAISGMPLEAALVGVSELAEGLAATVNAAPDLEELGVRIERLHFNHVAATPEMRKALEADYREGLQRRADQAIYARRAAAVAEERKIRESELETDVELEKRRRDLVEMQAENGLRLAEAEARADELKLNPYAQMPSQALVALALKEWATNAGNIGNLNITPDMLAQLVGWVGAARQ